MKKVYIVGALIFILFPIFIIQAGPTLAESNFFDGLQKTGEVGAGYPKAAADDPINFLAKMIGSALTPMFLGVVGMLLFFYGGYTIMMARGNEQRVERGKTIIINTVIAMLVAFSAYAIVKLIIPLWSYITNE